MKEYEHPFFSVVVPIYNAAPFLKKCIESLMNQTFSNIEMIFVNDGSTDESLSICNAYAKQDGRIFVWNQKNMGRVAARKAGVRLAKGRYVSFVDADDWVDEDMYEQLYRHIKNSGENADIVAFGLIEEYGDRQVVKRENINADFYESAVWDKLKERILYTGHFFEFGMLPHLCDKVFKKEILLSSGFMELDEALVYGEDAAATFRICLESHSLLVLGITPYHYRQNNYTAGLRTLQVAQENFCVLYREFQNSIEKRPHRDIFERQISFYFWFVLLLRQFENLQLKKGLFPYPQSVFDKKVILYGAGGFGIEVYKYIRKTGCCEIVGWVDREHASEDKRELPLESPEGICAKSFDYVLITILNEQAAKRIKEELEKKGVPSEKIWYIEGSCLEGEILPKWLTDCDEKN